MNTYPFLSYLLCWVAHYFILWMVFVFDYHDANVVTVLHLAFNVAFPTPSQAFGCLQALPLCLAPALPSAPLSAWLISQLFLGGLAQLSVPLGSPSDYISSLHIALA